MMGHNNVVQQLKVALVGTNLLRLFNPSAETEIHTDASKYGYSAVLLKYSYELEVVAKIEDLKKLMLIRNGNAS